MQDRRGLYAKYYAFSSNPFGELMNPDNATLEQRRPDITRIDQQVHFSSKEAWSDLPFDLTNFIAVWEGFLVIDKPGDYWLFTGADFQSNVTLDGELILLNNYRDYTEASTVLTLDAGLHPLRIQYMEAKHGSPIDPLGSCNFMYVPEGKSKPVPVPPSMLMLPEALWSNDAPIITRLSKNSGEIGDEITIYGQGFDSKMVQANTKHPSQGDKETRLLEVLFGGQLAQVVERAPMSLRVTVPIGAVSGKIVVQITKGLATSAGGMGKAGRTTNVSFSGKIPVPSNSVDFTVTTQFGLVASWHNLEGWSNYGFIEPGTREPDLVRLERDFQFDSRDQLDLPFRNNPLACRWEGKLGVPKGWAGNYSLVFSGQPPSRVTLGDRTLVGDDRQKAALMSFTIPEGECYLPLTIDWAAAGTAADLRVFLLAENDVVQVGPQFFFPPAIPPKPPVISNIKAVPDAEPVQLPYTVSSGQPAIREGREFTFNLTVFGGDDVKAEQVHVTVDGQPITYVVTGKRNNKGAEIRTCRGTLPSGLGEGAMRARIATVTSEPVYIDVQNKGLVAYYYDLPNPGGYPKMPELGPLTCFFVRKDPWVSFENANEFDLPFPAETFAVEWHGALIVDTEGDYTFTCRSDDGIKIWLDNRLMLEDDNLHYQREKSSAPMRLAPGTYPFRMEFFENNVHEVSVLYWTCKLGNEVLIPRQVIPKRNWTWDGVAGLPLKTSTGKRADGSDPQ
jgi:hypothetical protein